MTDGPEKKELDAFEKQLLEKLIAGKARRRKEKTTRRADLRLELKLEPQPNFHRAEQAKHADSARGRNRTGDAEEKAALDAYETELLAELVKAYSSGSVDPAKRFEALDDRGRASRKLRPSIQANPSSRSKRRTGMPSWLGKLDILRATHRALAVRMWSQSRMFAGPPSGPDIAPTRVLIRGNYNQPGEVVEAGFPSAITGNSEPSGARDRPLPPVPYARAAASPWRTGSPVPTIR